ncbi:hypothetical protein OROHE_011241 [Orobanche hederae]
MSSQGILKIRDCTPLEAEEILTYINALETDRFSSQGILKVRDCTPMEAEEILTYKKIPRNGSVCYFSSKPSQEILKIRDGTPLEAEEILTYIKSPRNGSICYFSSKLDVPSNVVQKKKVARILFFKIRPSQKILKIRDGTPLRVQKKRVARILFYKIRPSQEILKIRDGTPLEAEEILTYIKSPRNGSVCYFSSKLDVPSNVVQKKRVARILFFKIRPSQEILKIRDGYPFGGGGNVDIHKKPSKRIDLLLFKQVRCPYKLDVPSNVVQKKRVARILFYKIRPSQEILKIRDGTPLEAEEILTYIKSPRNGSVCYFSSKLDVPSNVVQNKRVARILFFKIRPSQEILKIRDGYPFGGGGNVDIHKKPSKRIDLLLFKQVRCP